MKETETTKAFEAADRAKETAATAQSAALGATKAAHEATKARQGGNPAEAQEKGFLPDVAFP